MWAGETEQKWRTNKKREEWVVNAKSGHEDDQREEQYCDANEDRKII